MRTLLLFGFTFSIVGCGGAVSTEPTTAPTADATQSAMIERTIVHRHGDGTESVDQVEVPLAQATAEHDAWLARQKGGHVAAPQVGLDSACGGASMWLFDHTYAHPSGTFPFNHEICFFDDGGDPCVDLRKYSRYCFVSGRQFKCAYWAAGYSSSIQSFFSGSSEGHFAGTDGFFSGAAYFGRTYQADDVSQYPNGEWIQHAQYLCFDR